MADVKNEATRGVMDPVVQAFMALSCILPDLMDRKDISLWAADPEKILMFDAYGRVPRLAEPGDPLTPGGTPELVLRTKQKVARHVPPQVYGVACKTIAFPINEYAIGLTYSVENEEVVRHSIGQLTSEIDRVSDSSHLITEVARQISKSMGTLVDTLSQTENQLKEIDRIGEVVGDIAEDSRYISINALVEANRAGEHGRGFSVVATEMQKLSDQTQTLIKKVNQNLLEINRFFSELQDLVKTVEGDVQAQSDSSQEIAGSLAEISLSVQDIEKIAQKL